MLRNCFLISLNTVSFSFLSITHFPSLCRTQKLSSSIFQIQTHHQIKIYIGRNVISSFNFVYYKINPSADPNNPVAATTTLTTSNDTISTTTDLSQVVDNVMPSIVSITSITISVTCPFS